MPGISFSTIMLCLVTTSICENHARNDVTVIPRPECNVRCISLMAGNVESAYHTTIEYERENFGQCRVSTR